MGELHQEWKESKLYLRNWLVVLACLSYSYFVVSKIPKGKFRFFLLLPVFYLFTIIPLSLTAPLLSGVSAFFFTWLANFKLLLFAFNHGPLSQKHISYLKFMLIGALPIKIRQSQIGPSLIKKKQNRRPKILPLNIWPQAISFALLSYVSNLCIQQKIRREIQYLIYYGLIYLLLDITLCLFNMLVGFILGTELDPPFDEPYLSTSLQDFWGRRWNLIVRDILDQTIYTPVKSTLLRLGIKGRIWATCLGIMAAFVVSGLTHELIFYYMSRAMPTGEVMLFFVLHGVCVVLEVLLKQALGQRVKLHWVISCPLTLGFVMSTGFWLFFPQIVRNGVDVRSIDDTACVFRYFREFIVVVIEKVNELIL